jgi:hypothetical protein
MNWEVLLDDDFALWLAGLAEYERIEILARSELLRALGPQLGRPAVDTVKGSRHPNMKELRLRIGGDPWRILFAFDPNRAAILLVGGNKRGEKRWYKTHIPIADERLDRHLGRLQDED